jgi:hypothetical protein
MDVVFEAADLFPTKHFTREDVADIYTHASRYQQIYDSTGKFGNSLEEILGRDVDRRLLPELSLRHGTADREKDTERVLHSIVYDSHMLGLAKRASFTLSGAHEEMIKTYILGHLAWERYQACFENHGERKQSLYIYSHLMERKHGKLKREEFKKIVAGMGAADFGLEKIAPLKDQYFRLAFPRWIDALFEGSIPDYTETVGEHELDYFLQRLFDDFEKIEKQRDYFPKIARFSITEPTSRLCTIEMEAVVEDLCFTQNGELITLSSDFENNSFIANLFDTEGRKKAEYVLTSASPGNFQRHHIELNLWKNAIALVIDGRLYPFDTELNLLEPEPKSPYALMRVDYPVKTQDLREMLNRNLLISLSTVELETGPVDFGVYLGSETMTGKHALVMRGDGKYFTFRFNTNGLWPAKSETPAIAAFPDGSVLVYSGDFYKINPSFTRSAPFAFPFTSNTESCSGDSASSNSHFATDPLGRLYIINQYKEFEEVGKDDSFLQIIGGYDRVKAQVNAAKGFVKDYTLRLADYEPTPSLKLMRIRKNKPKHLTAVPMSGVGHIDYFGSVAVAPDLRFALAVWDKIHLYEPIKERAVLRGRPYQQLPQSG